MSNLNLVSVLSDAEKINLFNKLCEVKQSEVIDTLKAQGFEWSKGKRSSTDYSLVDSAIIKTLADYPQGLKTSVLQFFVCEQSDSSLFECTAQQFNSRIASLAKANKIAAIEGKRGFYQAV